MNSVTLLYSLLLSVACMSMAVEPIIIGCSNPPSLVAPTIEFRQGQNVCGPSDVLFWIRFIGSGGQYRLRSGFFPRAAGEMACSVDINTLQVSPNSDPSAGSAELSITSPNGTTNFSLYYTSGAILPITPSTVEVIEGTTNVKMTWLHSSARGSLTLIHYSPDGQVRKFLINSFGNINSDQFTVDLASACELLQDRLATRSVTINKVTMSLGGVYSVIYTNETTVSVIRNITVVVLPAATPSVTPSLTTSNTISTSFDTPNGSTSVTTSQAPTKSPVPAAVPIAGIIAAVLVVLSVIVVVFVIIIIAAFVTYKKRRTGVARFVHPAAGAGASPTISRQTSIGRKNSNNSVSSQTVLMQSRAGSVSTRSGSFSTPGTPSKPDYTGVYATSEFAHITAKMLDKYKDQVRELKSKDEIITALLDPHCKEILAFAGSNGTTDWEGIFKETESRAFPTTDSPKITRVIFSDSDPAEGQCVETGRVKFVYFVGKPDEPDILEKLMMKGDLPVFKKDSHQRYPSSDATLLTQDSRNETDHPSPINEEERTLQAPKAPCSNHSESPAVTHVKSEINLSASTNSTPSPVKKDRHPTAATSMQLTPASHKNVEQLQTPATGLQSTSAPLINTRVEDLLAEQIELHKKELILMESINQNTQKSANKAEEQVELLTEQLVAESKPIPP